LVGATVTSYLLERSRVTSHELGERAYHIFYQLLKDADTQPLLKDCALAGNKFSYASEAPLAQDEGMLSNVLDALTAIGVKPNTVKSLLQVLASILHVGNIEFEDVDVPGKGTVAQVSSDSAKSDFVKTAARLLCIDPGALVQVF